MSADSGYGVRLQGSRATVTGAENSLESINTFELDDGCVVIIKSNLSEYILDKLSVAAPSGDDIVAPAQGGPGRWFKYPTSSGGADFERLSHTWFVDGDTAVAPADQTGSIAKPFSTIQQGVDDALVLAEPVRLIVQAGTYPEDVVITGGQIEIVGQGSLLDLVLVESISWQTTGDASLRLERITTVDTLLVTVAGGGGSTLELHNCDIVLDASAVVEHIFVTTVSGDSVPYSIGLDGFQSRIQGTVGSNFATITNSVIGAAGFAASQLTCQDCDSDPNAVFTIQQNGIGIFTWVSAQQATFDSLNMNGDAECRVENCIITGEVNVTASESTLNFLNCVINHIDVDPGDGNEGTIRVSGTDAPGAGEYRASVNTVDFHSGGEAPNELIFITTLIRLPAVISVWEFVSEGCSIPENFDLTVVAPEGAIIHDIIEIDDTPVGIDATSVEMDAATAMLWLEVGGTVTGILRILGSVVYSTSAALNVAADTAATVTFAVLGLQTTHNVCVDLDDPGSDFIVVMSNNVPADDQLAVTFRNFDPANAFNAEVFIQGVFGTQF